MRTGYGVVLHHRSGSALVGNGIHGVFARIDISGGTIVIDIPGFGTETYPTLSLSYG
jgi:hypothetical protein